MFVEYLNFWTGWKYNEDTMIPDPGVILKKVPRPVIALQSYCYRY